MSFLVRAGMNARVTYEMRSGQCEYCGSSFVIDNNHPQIDDQRWCPVCKDYTRGRLKSAGTIQDKK